MLEKPKNHTWILMPRKHWESSVTNDDDYVMYDDKNWELNIENLLIENYLEWTTIDGKQPPLVLPDKTLFCNDSCNLVLKESSDNLNLKLQSLTPPSSLPSPSSSSSLSSSSSSSSSSSLSSLDLLSSTATLASNNDSIDKVFTCNFGDCRKIYAKAAHLKAHLRRHIGDKPYVCTWPNCTWKFSRSDELSRHRRSHSGIKPYKCDYCTKCFSRSDHLTKHRKVHERKMAALKLKTVWTNLPQGKPGRRPKQ